MNVISREPLCAIDATLLGGHLSLKVRKVSSRLFTFDEVLLTQHQNIHS